MCKAGRYYLPGTVTGLRETLVTSSDLAQPQYILTLPGPGWSPVVGAVFTAAFFLLLTGKFVLPALACGVLAVVAIIVWAWGNDQGPAEPADIGGGICLPVNVTGRNSHAWLATLILNIVLFNIFAGVIFTYLFLWTVNESFLPAASAMPDLPWPALSIAMLVGGSALVGVARRTLGSAVITIALLLLAAVLIVAGVAPAAYAHWAAGLRPDVNSYGATVFTLFGLAASVAISAVILCLYSIARIVAGLLDERRRLTFEVTAMVCHYAVAQAVLTVAFVTAMPRLLGP